MYRLYKKDAKLTTAGRYWNQKLQPKISRLIEEMSKNGVMVMDAKLLLTGLVVTESAVRNMRIRINLKTQKRKKKIK